MRRKKRILGVLMIVMALLIMQLPVSEADAATSASDFVIQSGTLLKYRGYEKNVTIPDTVEVISKDAFEQNKNIELVVIPNSVKRIEPYAFWWCDNLHTIALGTGLTEIGDYAFAGCTGLQQMTIPKNVTTIGINAFSDCVNMKTITIPPETRNIHETAFENCYQLKINYTQGTEADRYAQWFYEHQKEMPEYEDVTGFNPSDPTASTSQPFVPQPSTPQPAAGETQVGSATIVGDSAFIFVDSVQLRVYDGGAYLEVETTPIASMWDDLSDGLAKFTVVDGRVIADQAYYHSSRLRMLNLQEGIREIGQFAFARSSLVGITAPEGLTDIAYGAFYHCDNLLEVTLPETVMNVEPKAFVYTAWVDEFLNGDTSVEGDFLIEGGVLVAYRGNGATVEIPEGVRVIAGEAFADHTEITALSLPDSLQVVGEAAFAGCSHLSDVQFGTGVREIKDRAFQGTRFADRAVSLPPSVEKLGLLAFGNAEIICEGEVPELTHETSAERLSNVAYRVYPLGQSANRGVKVEGLENASASLEGAGDSYTLTVQVPENTSPMKKACMRAFGEELPADMVIYDLTLTDSSGISLTKLGMQTLTVVLPVPEQLKGQNLKLLTLDRNGQAETVAVERVTLDGVESMLFRVRHLSLFGVYGAGAADTDPELFEISVEVNSLSAPSVPEEDFSARRYVPKFAVGGAMLLTGLIVIASGGRGRKIQKSRQPEPESGMEKQNTETGKVTKPRERCIRK